MEVTMSDSSKRKDCSCTTRPHGNPKYSNGSCYHSGDVRPAVKERIAGKKLCREWKLVTEEDEPV